MAEPMREEWITVFHSQHSRRVRLMADMLSACGLRTFVSAPTNSKQSMSGEQQSCPEIRVPVSQAAKAKELLLGYGLMN